MPLEPSITPGTVAANVNLAPALLKICTTVIVSISQIQVQVLPV